MSTTANQPVVFILDNVADYQSTADGLYANYEVHILSADGDALAQMVALLDGRTGLDAIHLISHGDAGVLDLGTLSLTSENLGDNSAALAALGAALSADGDFLIYGCDVAQGDVGTAFVDALAEVTGADVAASNDTTGPVSQGGDADLEVQTGSIEASTLSQDAFQTSLGVEAIVVSSPGFDVAEDGTGSGWTTVSGSQTGVLSVSGGVDHGAFAVDGTSYTDDGGNITAVGQFGNLYLDPVSGAYEYIPSAVAIDALDDGDVFTDTFTFSTTSSAGDIDTGSFTFTVTGSNDAPVITLDGALGATITEASGLDNAIEGKESAQVVVLINDPENNAQLDSLALQADGWQLSADPSFMVHTAAYGSAQLDMGTGEVTYTLNNALEATQLLNVGDQVTETFYVSVVDTQGLTDRVAVSFEVTGADDSAVLVVNQAVPAATYIDGNGVEQTNYNRTGVLSVTDIDTLVSSYGSLNYSLMGGTADDGGNVGIAGQLGSLYVNASSGQFDFVGSAAAIELLAPGASMTDTFTFSVTDAYGVTSHSVYEVEFVGVPPQEI